jgi:uncharacterized protein YdaU (DUF1376 family)
VNYYTFHIGDYVSRTRHLSPIEDLAYRRLLDLYYQREGPLLGNAAALSRLIALTEHEAAVAAVLSEFFAETAKGWRQKRCDEEIARYNDVCRRNRSNGKLGGRPKTETQRVPSGFPDGFQKEPTGNPPSTQYPTTSTQVQSTPSPSAPESESRPAPKPQKADPLEYFGLFWGAYGYKVGRKDAEKAWKAAKITEDMIPRLIQRAREYRAFLAARQSQEFQAHPATWINGRRWEDEQVGPAAPKSSLNGAHS